MWPYQLIFLLHLPHILLALSATYHHQSVNRPPPDEPPICSEHHNASISGYTIQMYPGDAVVSVLTNEPLAVGDLNVAALNDLLLGASDPAANVTLGVRLLYAHSLDATLHDFLLLEVQYLQQCTASPIAILVQYELWPLVANIADDIEYNIWRLPAATRLLYPRVAHLLYELPWIAVGATPEAGRVESLSVYAADVEAEDAFVRAAREEHLCLLAAHSAGGGQSERGGQIALGREAFLRARGVGADGVEVGAEEEDADKDARRNGLRVAVPLVIEDYLFIRNLSVGTYVISEAIHTSRVTLVLTISAILAQLTKLMHASLRDCATTNSTTNPTAPSHQFAPFDPFAAAESFHTACKHPENWQLDTISTLSGHELYSQIPWNALNIEPSIELQRVFAAKVPTDPPSPELRRIATIHLLENITTFYNYSDHLAPQPTEPTLGTHFLCENVTARESSVHIYNIYTDFSAEMYWRIRPEIWVAIGLTLAVLGILISFAIFVFVLVRLYMEDVLEGNPVGTIALLISLIVLFTSFIPFCVEYTSDRWVLDVGSHRPADGPETPVALCATRIVLVMLGYCFPFALLLCRTMMLASIGSEGGFLSHVNGYIQSVICVFTALVQVGMSVQLVVLVVGYQEAMSCEAFYYGAWFWVLLGYDGFLLLLMLVLAPFCVRSQRNYKEGLLILVGAVLSVSVWAAWIPMAAVDREWRDAAVPLGMQATGWAILGAILVPRSFLIVRGIARSDMAQALPSLASLAFAHNSQCMSEQSIYECVNPAMRQQSQLTGGGGGGGGGVNNNMLGGHHQQQHHHQYHHQNEAVVEDEYGAYEYGDDRCQSPSEIPTLPLRGASRKQRNMVEYASSQQSTMPASPNKATRF